MSPEFISILLQAGEWASGMVLKQASWNKELGRLDIHLSSPRLLTIEQERHLKELLAERFCSLNICLRIEQITPEIQKIKSKAQSNPPMQKNAEGKLLLGKRIAQASIVPMRELNEESGRVTIEGRPITVELRKLNKTADRYIVIVMISDYTNTVQCKAFLEKKAALLLESNIEAAKKAGEFLRVRGNCEYDKFSSDLVIRMDDVMTAPGNVRQDTMPEKRVELHLHTQMSSMDGLTNVSEAIARAAQWGHKTIAITDHGVAQAFPEAFKAGHKHGVKVLFGVEGYLQPDTAFLSMEQTYVVFDLETTGLKAEQEHIIEIGAVKLLGGKVIGRFSTFVNAGVTIPPFIVGLTGITDDMVTNAPLAREALQDFAEFCEGSVLVAHNAQFDIGFIRVHGQRYGISFQQPYADTLMLSRYLLFGIKNHKLQTVCEALGVELMNHHRAVDDAAATAELFLEFLSRIRAMGLNEIPAFTQQSEKQEQGKRQKNKHVVLLAQTQAGLKNLYRLVSHAHLDFFNKKPVIPKSLLHLYRQELLVGSACEQGEVIQAILQGKNEEEIAAIASWYDYLEIQPIGNNAFLVRDGILPDEESLRELNRRVVRLGEQLNRPVVATGDVHFLNPEDAIFRAILMHHEGYKDAHLQAPLYYRTTNEMLEEFSYLGEQEAYNVVVKAPNEIANLCEELKPYPDGTFAPKLDHAEQSLEEQAVARAHALYGDTLPDTVEKRLAKELRSIIDNGFSSLYLVAQKLVKKSLSDGYLVGSRGSVGSSFVATLLGITEVNPLPPHYVCPQCRHSDFQIDRTHYACGVDMPNATCSCGASYKKEGFDIPFEVFLGFHGDKTPDIDLNFSGEYQSVAHKFTEEMFGAGHAYRAGTISSIQKKTAYGYVMKYIEERGLNASKLEIERLCIGCTGVKRTTGQHPGGIVIVPKDNDILNFTPVQFPSDQQEKGTITTHFDFHALDDRLVKLDILGHVDPTALRMLQDITGIDPLTIALDDADTLRLYASAEPLGVDLTELGGCDVGSLGVPEFGTSFVRQMLKDTRPTTMEELVRIAGLSHGTDVWLNNAQQLVLDGTATLKEVICTRDDIMNYLIASGCDPQSSFKIMENVRKGRGVTDAMKNEMRMHSVPLWFIESCEKIKYMFPRAHAVAYVMMSFRIAFFKMHYPKAFYAVYYTARADTFDVCAATGGPEKVLREIKAIKAKGRDASDVENNLLTILEVVYEMNMRGIALLPVDIYRSHASKFLVEEEGIRAPFSALAGIGEAAAEVIAKNITGEKFLSVEDFQNKTGANSAAIASLDEMGCFEGFPKTNQISMF